MKFETHTQAPDLYELKEIHAKLYRSLQTFDKKKDDGRISKETKAHYQKMINDTMERIEKVEATMNKMMFGNLTKV